MASGEARVGVQATHAYIERIDLPGDVKLTIGHDASPETTYRAGVENLRSGNPRPARQYIWDAMMGGHVNAEVTFHWLVAMLSGRTVQQFSKEEIEQLKYSRSRYADSEGDAWADGVRLIYRLLESVPPSSAGEGEPKAPKTDMSLLVKEFESLGEEQRDMVRPHLELFLTGPLKDQVWQRRGLRGAGRGWEAAGSRSDVAGRQPPGVVAWRRLPGAALVPGRQA